MAVLSGMHFARFSVAIISLAATTSAAVQKQCTTLDPNVCFSLNFPDAALKSGKGDIYIQISAPTTNSWVSFAQGEKMAGSNFFFVYTSKDGKNVTLSARRSNGAGGHDTPKYDSSVQISLLDGSKVDNGVMVANIKCSNCQSWNGGSMNFKDPQTYWIWATRSGSSINSDDVSASLSMHNIYGGLVFDTSAQGGSSSNPFYSGDSSSSFTTSTDADSSATTSSTATSLSSSATASRSGNSSPTNIATPKTFATGPSTMRYTLLFIHAVLACLAFAVLFPVGGIMIRALHFQNVLWAHGVLQCFTYIVYVVGFAVGVHLSSHPQQGSTNKHYVAGILLFILLTFQAPLGYLHHKGYSLYGGRTIWSYLHLWIGRLAIPAGMINGVFGFDLAHNSHWIKTAYSVVAGIVFMIYIGSIIYGERRRKGVRQLAKPHADADAQLDRMIDRAGGGRWSRMTSYRNTRASKKISRESGSVGSIHVAMDTRDSRGDGWGWSRDPNAPRPPPPPSDYFSGTQGRF